MEVFDNSGDLLVGEQREIRGEAKFGIEDRMVVKNFWFGTVVYVGTAVAARMRELKSDEGEFVRTGRLSIRFD